MDANIIFVECRCRKEVIWKRLKKRETASSPASDARLRHLQAFKAHFEEPREISSELIISVDTERLLNENVAEIISRADRPVVKPGN
jgi:predicted kinase